MYLVSNLVSHNGHFLPLEDRGLSHVKPILRALYSFSPKNCTCVVLQAIIPSPFQDRSPALGDKSTHILSNLVPKTGGRFYVCLNRYRPRTRKHNLLVNFISECKNILHCCRSERYTMNKLLESADEIMALHTYER